MARGYSALLSAIMTATPSSARAAAIVAAGALIVTACTNPSGPDALARAEEPSTSILPPVTTSPLGTPVPPPTTSRSTTSAATGAGSNDQEATKIEDGEIVLAGVARIEEQLIPLLGSTANLSVAMNTIGPFPRAVPTPRDAVITGISVGAGTPTEDGTVLAQIGVSVVTTASSTSAFEQIANAVQAAGMFPIDSTGDTTNRSASFRMPGGDQFDELVLTSVPFGDGATVRIVSNAAVRRGDLSTFIDWADSKLPLPTSDQQRTLIVATSSGEGRLASTTLTVESSVVLEGASAQREANRLVARAEDSDVFGTNADLETDQALTGSLTFDQLDDLSYSVSPAVFTLVDSEGELQAVEVLEIRLTGSKSL